LTVSSNLHYYVQKQAQILNLLSMNSLFIVFKYSLYSDVFIYFHQHYLCKVFHYISV
jgi:hypothetical protein